MFECCDFFNGKHSWVLVLVMGSRLSYFIFLSGPRETGHILLLARLRVMNLPKAYKKKGEGEPSTKTLCKAKIMFGAFFPHIFLNDTGLFIRGHWWYCLHIVCMFCRFVCHDVCLIFDAAMSAYFMHFNWLGLVHLNHLVMHLNILPFAEVAHDYEMGKPLGFSFTRLCSLALEKLERCLPKNKEHKFFPWNIAWNNRPKRKGKLSSKH